jgi:hypothetical protein
MDERILDYGVTPFRQRRFYRRLVRAILFLGIVAAVLVLIPTGLVWIRYLYWQQRCLNYTAPPDQLVFHSTGGRQGEIYSLCVPEEQFWYNGGDDGGGFPACGIFVHAMRRPDGTKCLVELNLGTPEVSGSISELLHNLYYGVWTVSPIARLAHLGLADFPTINGVDKWKIYAGQPDPSNPSHFTFDFESNARRHTCDAWLNNSNQLVLSVRP